MEAISCVAQSVAHEGLNRLSAEITMNAVNAMIDNLNDCDRSGEGRLVAVGKLLREYHELSRCIKKLRGIAFGME